MKALKRIWAIFKKEAMHILRDKVIYSTAVTTPLLLTLLFGAIYVQGKVTQVPTVIYDADKSELSRMLVAGFRDSEKLNIYKYVESVEELREEMDNQRAEVGIILPQDLKKNVKSGQSQEIPVILSGLNSLNMSNASAAINQVISTYSAGINVKIMAGNGISSKKGMQAVQSLSYKSRTWYNPSTSYEMYMLLGLMGTLMQQVAFLAVSLSFSKERETGVWKNLIFSKIRSKELILGKFSIYFIIFFLDAIVMLTLGIELFKLPMLGNLSALLTLTATFIGAILMMGMFFSSLLKSQVQAMQLSMMIAVPSYILSGYTWPVFDMPILLQKLSSLLPLTHYLISMKAIMYMGQGFSATVLSDLKYLSLIIVIFLPLNILLVERRIRNN